MQTLEVKDGGEEQGSMGQGQIIRQKGAKSSTSKIWIQSEMIEEILCRLPVKTLFQFRCVSKPWHNLISDQSFVKLHSTHTNHHGLVISASNSIYKRYFIFASHNDGSITQILTVPGSKTFPRFNSTHAQHVNGFLLFCPAYGFDKNYLAFVYNPSTHKIFKVPPRGCDAPEGNKIHYCYLLGFDEWSNEHKILNFKTIGVNILAGYFSPIRVEIEIFSLSSYTWRKIDVDIPPDPGVVNWYHHCRGRVCINSAIYFMFLEMKSILVFDLRTETFSNMNFPPVNSPSNLLSLMTINGFLGVVCLERIADRNKMEFWILEDCQNQVWVKDTITLPDYWIDKNHTPYPLDFRGGEIVFKPDRMSTDLLSIPIYDMKKGTFRSLEVDLSHDILCSKMLQVRVCKVSSYVESMMSLKNSPELVPFISGKGNDKRSTINS